MLTVVSVIKSSACQLKSKASVDSNNIQADLDCDPQLLEQIEANPLAQIVCKSAALGDVT